MRLIDADALLAEYDRVHVGEPGNARKLIENAPTIEERKTGEWILCKASIHPYGNDVKCSECGHKMGSSFGYKFCPMCGSKMEGEQP